MNGHVMRMGRQLGKMRLTFLSLYAEAMNPRGRVRYLTPELLRSDGWRFEC